MSPSPKQRYQLVFDEIAACFHRSGRAAPVFESRTAVVDSIVLDAFASTLAQHASCGLCLLAVGGYGRKELFPYSDVDLLLLVRRPIDDPALKESLSFFLRSLWDSGLKVSHSVRTVDECCSVVEGNFELTVSLLDQRLLAGDAALHAALVERFQRFLAAERRDLTRRLCRLARQRHARYHGTIYRLEPDVKEHPGGLRDLHTLRWLRTLRDPAAASGPDALTVDFLSSVRCFLHFRTGRDTNLLAFDAQDEIAAAPFSSIHDPAEWMREWFRNAASMWRAVSAELETSEAQDRSLLSNFRDWRSRLSNADFTVSRDRVFFKSAAALDAGPQLALRFFLFIARHGIAPSADASRRVQEHQSAYAGHFRLPHDMAAFWREFFSLPRAVMALRVMDETGFLCALLPEWERIQHRVVRDFYHHYTVDEHTFVALEALEYLPQAEEPGRRRFAALLEDATDLAWLLRVALLLHDSGKASGIDHSIESERIAARFLERMNFSAEESAFVLFLVRNHLILSTIMQGRDLADPATALHAAHLVHTIEHLRLLSLMTYADIAAVNPTALNPWRMEQLWSLYCATAAALNRGLTEEKIARAEDAYGPLSPELAAFLEGLPLRYLWTHSRLQAEAHCTLFRQAASRGIGLDLHRAEGTWRLSIVAPDRPFLFASLCAALASFGVNILKAEAFSNARHFIVDSFAFSDPSHNLELNPPEVERLRSTLRKVAAGDLRAEDLLKHRPVKPPPSRLSAIQPAVSSPASSSAQTTIVEVVAQDRPGLLYLLTSTISRAGANIEVVLVDTEAHKAIDVFHLTRDGRPLDSADSAALLDALKIACSAPL